MPCAAATSRGDCMGKERLADTAPQPVGHDEELSEIERIGGIAQRERGNPRHHSVCLCDPDVAGRNLLGFDFERRPRERCEGAVVAPYRL